MNFKFGIYGAIAAMVCLAPLSYAQQNADVDAVKQRAALNSVKADLEEARKKRDMAVAARWKDRETANQERELFNEKYNESKEKVDALMSERARLFEDVRVAREDLAQVKLQAEKARAEYLSLAAGPERLETLAKFSEQGIPFKIAERVEVQNKVKKEMGLYRDDPLRIAQSVLNAARAEMAFTRESGVEKAANAYVFLFETSNASQGKLRGAFTEDLITYNKKDKFYEAAVAYDEKNGTQLIYGRPVSIDERVARHTLSVVSVIEGFNKVGLTRTVSVTGRDNVGVGGVNVGEFKLVDGCIPSYRNIMDNGCGYYLLDVEG